MELHGLCRGASRLQMVTLAVDQNGRLSVERTFIAAHQGNPSAAVLDALGKREGEIGPFPSPLPVENSKII